MTTVTVVIPSYNRSHYLQACLDSVAAQQRAPDEVIVVDDGSTDGTREVLAARPGITVVSQTNSGPGAARNRGAQAASGDYIAFLDSDDLWFPWSLDAMMTLVQEHRPSLLFARYEDFENAPPVPISAVPEGEVYKDYLASTQHSYFAGAGMMVVSRTAFHNVGGFCEDRLNAEDHDLALRLGTAPGFVQTRTPVTVAHRVHAGNAMGDESANLGGLRRLISNERAGCYPGGSERRVDRQRLIAMHVRPAVLAAARAGRSGRAFSLYRETLSFQFAARRAAFLAAAPVVILAGLSRPITRGGRPSTT